jgi:quinoprotein glucose dehydrogenase
MTPTVATGAMSPVRRVLLIATLASAGLTAAAQQPGTQNGEWRFHGGDSGSTKYSSLDQITPSNVKTLQMAWRHDSVDPRVRAEHPDLFIVNNFRATPIMVDGVLYLSNGVGLVEALDPATGRTLWTQEPGDPGLDGFKGGPSRGVAYWNGGTDRRILAVRGEYLYALNASTGKTYPDFGVNGRVDLKRGMGPLMTRFNWTSAPLVIRDVVIVGAGGSDTPRDKEAAPGDVRAFDVRTGQQRWTFHVIPRENEFGVETWEDGSWQYTGNANAWSLLSADERLGYVYVPLTSATNDWYGGHRRGDNLFSDALVCLDVATGRRVWHYQIVHHDLWDYDLPTAPVLADITVQGRKIKAVVQVTKQAFAFVFDRVTGKPVWPIEERPVGGSKTPGEKASATQPFPTKPPAFDRQGITVDDLIDFTPELRREAEQIVKGYVIGPMFTPPSIGSDSPEGTGGTIIVPGWVGGADWGGAAFDPETAVLYVPSVTAPITVGLMDQPAGRGNLRYVFKSRNYTVGPQGLPLLKPPYGRITAIALNRGEHLWMVPNGDGPRNHPLLKHLNLPPLGQPGRVAPLLTKKLLFLGEGDPINLSTPVGGGGNKFRAYDKTTGDVVWETELPAGTTGAPMTYQYRGRQYVVVAIGSTTHPGELMSFALPSKAPTQTSPSGKP